MCIFRKCSFQKCIFQKCIFQKCIFESVFSKSVFLQNVLDLRAQIALLPFVVLCVQWLDIQRHVLDAACIEAAFWHSHIYWLPRRKEINLLKTNCLSSISFALSITPCKSKNAYCAKMFFASRSNFTSLSYFD